MEQILQQTVTAYTEQVRLVSAQLKARPRRSGLTCSRPKPSLSRRRLSCVMLQRARCGTRNTRWQSCAAAPRSDLFGPG